jgi:hypothetical protein
LELFSHIQGDPVNEHLILVGNLLPTELDDSLIESPGWIEHKISNDWLLSALMGIGVSLLFGSILVSY